MYFDFPKPTFHFLAQRFNKGQKHCSSGRKKIDEHAVLSVSHPLDVWTLIFSPTSIFSGLGGGSDPPRHEDWDGEHGNTAAVPPLDTQMPNPFVLLGPISHVAVPMQCQCLGKWKKMNVWIFDGSWFQCFPFNIHMTYVLYISINMYIYMYIYINVHV